MSRAELLIPAPVVPVRETPQGSSDHAQLPAGGRPSRGGLFGGVGTVEDDLTRLEIRLLADAGGDPAAEQDVRRCMDAARTRFAGAKVRRFLPILIERDVRRQLAGR
jgi:hypothetical protein